MDLEKEKKYNFSKIVSFSTYTRDVHDFTNKNDLSFLINHRLEAVDRKNPHLIAPASISKLIEKYIFINKI